MAKAPVRRLTALLTASSRGIEGVRGRVRTASEVFASGDSVADPPKRSLDGAPGFVASAAARLSSFSMRWAMISVSVSETNLWPLAMSSDLRAR